MLFRVGGEVGDYLKYYPVADKILLLCLENVFGKIFLKKPFSLKMYVTMKYQFILHDESIMRVTSNHPYIPCFFQAP